MSRTTAILSLITAFGGSLLVATACAPQDDKAPVTIARKNVATKAMDECLSQVRGREANISKRFVRVCEVSTREAAFESASNAVPATELASASTSEKTSKTGYSLQSREVRYQVGHRNEKLVISLRVGLFYPENQAREIRTGIQRVITGQCQPKINELWARQNVELDLQFQTAKDDADVDQDLVLIAHPEQKNALYPHWVAAGWPDQGDLYPVGRPEDKSECKILGDAEDEQRCLWDRYEAANQRFCVSLALKVGEWLGLEDPRTKTCAGSVAAAGSPSPEAVPGKSKTLGAESATSGATSSFMKAAENTELMGGKFWEKAKISGMDLKTVLGPACSGFKSLRENPAR